jgi:hypothetical protein
MIEDGRDMDRIIFVSWVNNCKPRSKLVEYRKDPTYAIYFIS